MCVRRPLLWPASRYLYKLMFGRRRWFSTDFRWPFTENEHPPRKEYAERRLLGYSKEQMYDIVSDTEAYPKFVPWCRNVCVAYRRSGLALVEMEVGFLFFVERYTSSVLLDKPFMVKSAAIDGHIFNHLINEWHFSDGLDNVEQSCTLDFSVEFEFSSAMHGKVAHVFFDRVVMTQINAFLTRAKQLHGPSALPEHESNRTVLRYRR